MRTLPKLPAKIPHRQSQVLKFLGINFSDDYASGNLAVCKNISSRRYPYFTTRNERSKVDGYDNITAMTNWNKLVAVRGTDLLYDGTVVGQVTEGVKQFAVLNTKLVIFPDKVYLDLNTLTVLPLGSSTEVTDVTFTNNSIVSANANFNEHFSTGDAITISGCANTNNNKTIKIKSVSSNTITTEDNVLVSATENRTITFSRNIPDLDYICESENRLWGCSNADKTIYSSALGDPTNFFDYSGLSTDSFAVAVGSEGTFTGCAKLQSSIVFFKENTVHKVLGSFPAEYQLYSYKLEGIKDGCYKSVIEINGSLFYMGIHGVCAYSGGSASTISSQFGNHTYDDAVGGTDGDSYYLSCREGDTWNLFVYDLKTGLWMQEDNTRVIDFARSGATLYFLDSDGDIMIADSGVQSNNIEWVMQFKPFIETTSGSYNSTSSVFAKKRYSKMVIRVDMPEMSHCKVEVRFDEGEWQTKAEIDGYMENIKPIVIGINRCDKFEIRLSGWGEFTLLNMVRYYIVGSDRS